MASKIWTEEEIEFLKENADKLHRSDIANRLGRSIGSVEGKCKKINIKLSVCRKQIQGKKWTDKEIDYLKKNYQLIDTNDIAKELDRTYTSVLTRANKLNIKKFKQSEKEGYCICKKCKRELPRDYQHFPPDKGCVDGLRSICRECDTSNENFLPYDYVKPFIMTDEEEKLFIERYPYYTNDELLNTFYIDWSEKGITEKASKLRKLNKYDLNKTKETKDRAKSAMIEKVKIANTGRTFSEETIERMSQARKEYYKTHTSPWIGRVVSEEEKKKSAERNRGKWAGNKNPRHLNPLNGEKNGRWDGGITSFYEELRTQIVDWKKESMKNCNYKCVITGESFDVIHHLHPFKNIVEETLSNLGYSQRRMVKDYSKDEFKNVVKELQRLHMQYPLGVCITKEMHLKFHSTYGWVGNTAEQFEEFVDKMKL